MRSRFYPSARDWWMSLTVWGVILLALACTAPAIKLASPTELAVMMALVMAVNAVLLWVLYGTGYWYEGDHLRVRMGPVRLAIPVAKIESVAPIRNWQSSPACSIDRLVLRYDGRALMISPREKEAFVGELQQRNPSVKIVSLAA